MEYIWSHISGISGRFAGRSLPRAAWAWILGSLLLLGIGLLYLTGTDYGKLSGYLVFMSVACTLIPLPTPPFVIGMGKVFHPAVVAFVGALGNCIAAYAEYHVITWLFSKAELQQKIEGSKLFRRFSRVFGRTAFLCLFISGFAPIPFEPFRLSAILIHYAMPRYLLATFLGRFPRYYFMAMIGDRYQVPDRYLILLMVLCVAGVLITMAAKSLPRVFGPRGDGFSRKPVSPGVASSSPHRVTEEYVMSEMVYEQLLELETPKRSPSVEILVDSDEFWTSLRADVLDARDCVYMQTLSFEGDSVGRQLADLLLSSDAPDTRVAVDCYTRFFLSDRFLYTPKNIFDKELRHEASETSRLIDLLTDNGVQVRFTNPFGPLCMRLVRRNHRKSIVIDDRISYIGGINFTEHNFHWHDMMLRIEDPNIAAFLKEDFMATWDARRPNPSGRFEKTLLYVLDGHSNEVIFEDIMGLMDTAHRNIFIESPYLTFPFYEKLREIHGRGVDITIVAPETNNVTCLDTYVRWEALRSGFDLMLYRDRMTHLKAMLIDDRFLIIGSSNFDYLSYRSQQEILAIFTDTEVISDFGERVVARDLEDSVRFEGDVSSIAGYASAAMLKSFGKMSVFLSTIC